VGSIGLTGFFFEQKEMVMSNYEKELEIQNENLIRKTAELEELLDNFSERVEGRQEFLLNVIAHSWDLVLNQAQMIHMQKSIMTELGIDETEIDMARLNESSSAARRYLKNYIETIFSSPKDSKVDDYVLSLFRKYLVSKDELKVYN
jgi:hypothetical protein